MTASIDKASSALHIEPFSDIGGQKLPFEGFNFYTNRRYFYQSLSNESQGIYGKRSTSEVNPIASGYEFFSIPLVDVLGQSQIETREPMAARITYNHATYNLSFRKLVSSLRLRRSMAAA